MFEFDIPYIICANCANFSVCYGSVLDDEVLDSYLKAVDICDDFESEFTSALLDHFNL